MAASFPRLSIDQGWQNFFFFFLTKTIFLGGWGEGGVKPWVVFFLVYLFLLFYLYFHNSIYEFHIQYNFLSVSRRVNKHLNIFHNLCTKKKKKASTRWSDEVYVKSRESQKNYKNNNNNFFFFVSLCANPMSHHL